MSSVVAVAGSGLGIDGGDHPIRGDLPSDPQRPVVAGLQVLTEDRGQQPHRLTGRLGHIGEPVEDGEQGVTVACAGVHQGVAGGLVVPVDDRLAGAAVVVTTGQHGP